MKLAQNIIKFFFILSLEFLGQNVFGQGPPYQHSTSKILHEALEPDYYQVFGQGWIRYYLREDIPFYTMFNYTIIEDYNSETNFQRFYFRKFSSFTAPKGVRKITYYLGNNLIDSTKASTHVFFFNKKTNLLEKELKYEKDSLGLNHKKEYSYKYEETNHETIVKKLLKKQHSLILINQYIYSKDKTKLLKNETLFQTSNFL